MEYGINLFTKNNIKNIFKLFIIKIHVIISDYYEYIILFLLLKSSYETNTFLNNN